MVATIPPASEINCGARVLQLSPMTPTTSKSPTKMRSKATEDQHDSKHASNTQNVSSSHKISPQQLAVRTILKPPALDNKNINGNGSKLRRKSMIGLYESKYKYCVECSVVLDKDFSGKSASSSSLHTLASKAFQTTSEAASDVTISNERVPVWTNSTTDQSFSSENDFKTHKQSKNPIPTAASYSTDDTRKSKTVEVSEMTFNGIVQFSNKQSNISGSLLKSLQTTLQMYLNHITNQFRRNNTGDINMKTVTDHDTVTNTKIRMTRTTLVVEGICCATEVIIIRRILRDLERKSCNNSCEFMVHVNISSKNVYVKHDTNKVSSETISNQLIASGFPSTIVQVETIHVAGPVGDKFNTSPYLMANKSDEFGESIFDMKLESPLTFKSSYYNWGSTGLLLEKKMQLEEILKEHCYSQKRLIRNHNKVPPVTVTNIQRLDCTQQKMAQKKDCELFSPSLLSSPSSSSSDEESLHVRISVRHICTSILAQDLQKVLETIGLRLFRNEEEKDLQGHRKVHIKENGTKCTVTIFQDAQTVKASENAQQLMQNISHGWRQRKQDDLVPSDTSLHQQQQHNHLHNVQEISDQEMDNDSDTDSESDDNRKLLKTNTTESVIGIGDSSSYKKGIYDKNTTSKQQHLELTRVLSRLKIHVFFSGLFWIGSVASVIVANETSMKYCGMLSVLFGSPSVMYKAFRTLYRRRQFDANGMMVLAALGAIALEEYDEAASVSFLFALSELLEARASYQARNSLAQMKAMRPDCATVMNPTTNEMVVVPAERVPVGSYIVVRTGDKVAADGIVVEGTSSMDQSSLTGESLPLSVSVGDNICSGFINIGDGTLVVRTTELVHDSAVSRLIRLVEEAQTYHSPTEKLIDEFARSYTPIILFIAFIISTMPWLLYGSDIGRTWTLNGLILIVIACPCALTISTPVTYVSALAACAEKGIVVKGGGSCLEAMGKVSTVLFDKTGTLTEGRFQVTNLIYIGTNLPNSTQTRSNNDNNPHQVTEKGVEGFISKQKMLELIVLLEGPSSHPLSSTLVDAAKKEGSFSVVPYDDYVMKNHTILKGEGVTAIVNGRIVFIGNQRLFERIGRNMYQRLSSDVKDCVAQWNDLGCTVGFIGIEGYGIFGCYSMVDSVRKQSKQTIQQLQNKLGINHVLMLTGDGDGAAVKVAKQVGLPLSSVCSQLLPEDKLQLVKQLQEEDQTPNDDGDIILNDNDEHTRMLTSFSTNDLSDVKDRRRNTTTATVLFCGDGVNDAPALTLAHIGVSMGQNGSALALEMSDVTLMDSNPLKLLYVMEMGTSVITTIRQNIMLSFACKIIVVALTFTNNMTLLCAIAADVGVMLLVTMNGMKLLPTASLTSSSGINENTSTVSTNNMSETIPMNTTLQKSHKDSDDRRK